MRRLIHLLFLGIWFELFLIFSFLFLLNNYLGNSPSTINADATGYYDYLPSLFFRGDFVRKDDPFKIDNPFYKDILQNGNYVRLDNKLVNKYPVGTAFLESPFFFAARFTTKETIPKPTGYEMPYQRAVFHAAIFYLFWGLLFFRFLMQLYLVDRILIGCTQAFLLFATPLLHYASHDAGFSHVFSFFAITAFAYFSKRFFMKNDNASLYWSFALLGLILLIRQVNVLIIFALPFLAGNFSLFKEGLNHIFQDKKRLLIGIALIAFLLSLQVVAWYAQTGKPFVYSYQGESFNFLDSHFVSILFSYKKGLFIYTPLLFFSVMSVLFLLKKRDEFSVFSFLFFFGLITFVFSSWWSWYYGCSFGMRVYTDYISILLIPLVLCLSDFKLIAKTAILIFLFLMIPLNVIQAFQYKKYILHWIDMDKDKYWQVFLKTDSKYEGLLWKQKYDTSAWINIGCFNLEDLAINVRSGDQLLADIRIDTIPRIERLSYVTWQFNQTFKELSDIRLRLDICDSTGENNFYSHKIPYIQFQNEGFFKEQTGSYTYEIPPLQKGIYSIKLTAVSNERIRLHNPKLSFYAP